MSIRGVRSTRVDSVRGLSRQPLPTMPELLVTDAGVREE
jgi:hypothetical protein